jgi:diguanylate cyclase (GGDEF)-like protein
VPGSVRLAHVAVISSERSGDVSTYRLRVWEPGLAVNVMVPFDARRATLEIDGIARQAVGYDVPVGTAPLGHGTPMLRVAGVTPADRVVVRVWGSHQALRFLYNPDVMATEYALGYWSGAFYTTLAIVSFFILIAVCVRRDATMLWFLGFTLSLIGTELARDDLFPLDQNGNLAALLVVSVLSTLTVFGFSSSYLRLRTEAPRLFAAIIFWTIVPIGITLLFSVVTKRRIDSDTMIVPYTAGLVNLIVVALLRGRSGYVPAAYFSLGFLGLTTIFIWKIVRDVLGTPAPFVDRWAFEAGSIFDVLAFAVAVAIRSSYSERARELSEAGLRAATFDADHDPLTGLLNRRGLEATRGSAGSVRSTVLFVDLDGFKLINDLGGHAKGDEALKSTARILRNAVREGDAVARVGGDEFVVVLNGCVDPVVVKQITARIVAAIAFVHPLGDADPTGFGVSIGNAIAEPGQKLAVAVGQADAGAYSMKAEHYADVRNVADRRASRLKAREAPGGGTP